jgi:hypothetical protein
MSYCVCVPESYPLIKRILPVHNQLDLPFKKVDRFVEYFILAEVSQNEFIRLTEAEGKTTPSLTCSLPSSSLINIHFATSPII